MSAMGPGCSIVRAAARADRGRLDVDGGDGLRQLSGVTLAIIDSCDMPYIRFDVPLFKSCRGKRNRNNAEW